MNKTKLTHSTEYVAKNYISVPDRVLHAAREIDPKKLQQIKN